MENSMLLRICGLKKFFPFKGGIFSKAGIVKAVDGISFEIREGQTFALVGESGSGKTTVGLLALGLLSPTAGGVYPEGHNIFKLKASEMRERRRRMQMVFQDPYGSLNPRMTIGEMLREVLAFHRVVEPNFVNERTDELLKLVGLDSSYASRYPHEFSGGERQRIGIARAISIEPRLIVADEPVSSLDVSIRGQILNLLRDLQEKLGLAYLFIAHDLAVVRYISHRVGVMYLGRIVEEADTEELFTSPLHPYTRALLNSIPVPDPKTRSKRTVPAGEAPEDYEECAGCMFYNRCPRAERKCKEVEPELVTVEDNHLVACHLIDN
jgi:oligopeptide/dipeptide ABC transporter ATP-binding protein